jgi:hypothetical protein
MFKHLTLPSASPLALTSGTSVATAITVGVWVNLLTNEWNNASFLDAFRNLGWKNLWLVAAVMSIALQVIPPAVRSRRATRAYIDLAKPTMQKVLALTVTSRRALYASASMNGRYFYADTEGGKDVLVRENDVYFETELMPDEFGFDKAFVESDNLVICKSFRERVPIYEELPQDHPDRYDQRIRGSIDPDQAWVLACPVLPLDERSKKPLGVVCLYGKRPPARNPVEVRRLRQVSVYLSEVFARAIQGYVTVTRD